MNWDKSYDVVVVGSGAGAFSAALTAKAKGLSVVIVEKTDKYGGSSAISGGALWVPNSYILKEAGLKDSKEEVRLYLSETVGDRVNPVLLDTYIDRGPEMLDLFREKYPEMQFSWMPGYSDYYPEKPGGKPEGRTVEPLIFNLKKLGDWLPMMRRGEMPTKGMVLSSYEFGKVNMFARTWIGKLTALKIGFRFIHSWLPTFKPASLGEALIGRMSLSYKNSGGEMLLSTPFTDYVTENNRVVGIKANHKGKEIKIEAKQGVVVAAGGFSRSQQKRDEYLPHPTKVEWTSASPGQTGDFLEPSLKLGAKLDLMDKMWGAPSVVPPNEPPFFLVADRAIPNMMIVNGKGKRFLNEALPYEDLVYRVYQENDKGNKAVPTWLILDKKAKNRYLFTGLFPGQGFPKRWIKSGFVKKADTPEELAQQIGLPVQNFVEQFNRFNQMAEKGKDEDFQRGDSAYDRYYGDPTLSNPNMHPMKTKPIYAVPVVPGDIGTKGGIVMDEHARALREDDSVIEGLFVCGNSSAAIMGETYPGAGSTIGPAMTYGYLAVDYMEKNK